MGKKQKREKIQWFERNSSLQVDKRFFRYRAGVYSSAVSTAATQALVLVRGCPDEKKSEAGHGACTFCKCDVSFPVLYSGRLHDFSLLIWNAGV